jgi:hypothetical protein
MRDHRATFLALVACAVALHACGSSGATTPAVSASRFIDALNAKHVDEMVELSRTPFRYRNQTWESASDGTGFSLGAAQETVTDDVKELEALLRALTATVRIADTKPVADPPSKADLLSEPLRGAPPDWAEFDLVVFRRGEGDVEHIAIVGVDARSGKIAALYVN